jgi:type I restriction enzyme S subunit
MAEKKNIPEIRFKGFSGEWKESELGEMLDITSAARVHKNEWTESGVPFFRSSDVVSDYKGQENNKAFISFELYEELSNKIGRVQVNDILITGGGSIGIPYLIKNDEPLYFKDADLLWLKNGNKINGNFLYTFFSTLGFRRYVNSITHIGTISHYTVVQAKSTPFKVPEKAEQDKIGELLSNLDKLITLHQAKYNKLVNIKKAMLEKMFPKNGADVPEIRFKGFEGKWEFKTLEQVACLKQGEQVAIENHFFEKNDFRIRFIRIVDITNSDEPKRYIEYNGNNIVKEDDIFMVRYGPVGTVGYGYNGVIANNLFKFLPKIEIVPTYLFQLLRYLNPKIIELAGNTAMPALNFTSLKKLILPITNVEEQTKIGNYFQNLDKLITLHQKELDKLKNIKKGCLEKMFV